MRMNTRILVLSLLFSSFMLSTQFASSQHDGNIGTNQVMFDVPDQLIRTITATSDSEGVNALALSPDVLTVYVSHCDGVDSFDITTGQKIADIDGSMTNDLDLSPDGKILALSALRNEAKLVNTTDNSEIASLAGHSGYVIDLSFSPDGKLLATGSYDNTTKLWNMTDYSLIYTLGGHTDYIKGVAFNPTSDILATCSSDNDIIYWNCSTGTEILRIIEHDWTVLEIEFSPDSRFLASGAIGDNVNLFNASTGELLHTFYTSNQPVNAVAFSDDSSMLATGDWDGDIRIFSTEDYTLLNTLTGHVGWIEDIEFGPGDILASCGEDQTVKIWGVNPVDHVVTVPTVLYPNGGETLSGSVAIAWTAATCSHDHDITYTIQYSTGGSWITVIFGLTATNFVFNTSLLPDGDNYLIKVIATCSSGISAEDESNAVFSINNGGTSTTTTTSGTINESSTETTTTTTTGTFPFNTPGYTFPIILAAGIAAIYFKKRR